MGMYTNIMQPDVDVVDMDGLKEYLKKLKNGEYPQYTQKDSMFSDYNENIGPTYADALELDEKNKILSFQGFDNWKIISYWYDLFITFLRDIAVYLDGRVEMEYETNELGAFIDFMGGQCYINVGEMTWTKYSPEQMNAQKTSYGGKKQKRLPEMADDIKTHLVLRKL